MKYFHAKKIFSSSQKNLFLYNSLIKYIQLGEYKFLHLILGGRYMGKESYARNLYKNFAEFYNLEIDSPEKISRSGLITNLHMGVKFLLGEKINSLEFFKSKLEILRESVIIGNEICSGVIPIDEFSRKWRDETGNLYQFLAREADIVDRIFAGLPLRLKG